MVSISNILYNVRVALLVLTHNVLGLMSSSWVVWSTCTQNTCIVYVNPVVGRLFPTSHMHILMVISVLHSTETEFIK